MRKSLFTLMAIVFCFAIANTGFAGLFPSDVFSNGYDLPPLQSGIYDGNDTGIKTIDGLGVTMIGKYGVDDHSEDFGGFSISGPGKTGEWFNPNNLKVDYITFKAGTQFIVYDVNSQTYSNGDGQWWSTAGLLNDGGKQPDLSHITFWSKTPVPVPAAVWLLGTGLAGLVGIRRKMKK
jgi:hypothetical protein